MCFNLSPSLSLSLLSLSDLIIIIIVWRKKGQVDRQASRQAECEEVPLWLVGWLATYQVAKRRLLCIPDLTLLPLPALSDRKRPFFFLPSPRSPTKLPRKKGSGTTFLRFSRIRVA